MGRVQLAWIQLRSQWAQLVAAVIVIALGVALAAGMLLANAALRDGFAESVDALAGRATFQITPSFGGTLHESVVDTVRQVHGVSGAAPVLIGSGFWEAPDGADLRIRLVGVDMLDETTVRLYRESSGSAVEDPLLFLAQTDSIVVPEAILREMGASRGDELMIKTPGGPRPLTVRGVIGEEGVGAAFGGRLFVMDLYSAQDTLEAQERVSQIDVVLSDGANPEEVGARLREALPLHLAVEYVDSRKADLVRVVSGFQAMLNAIAAIGLVLAGLITANRLATVYQERFWELGVLRGMGWTPSDLVLDLLCEAALVALLGVSVGLPLGCVFAGLIAGPVADTMELSLQRTVAVGDVGPRLVPLLIAGGAGVLSGVVAAAVPAARAARVHISDLKDRKRRRDIRADGSVLRYARFLVPVLAAAILLVQLASGLEVLGALAMVLIIGSGVLLVQPVLSGTGILVGHLFPPPAWVGCNDQSRAPSRAMGATAVLLVGMGGVVWISGMGESFEQFVVQTNLGLKRGDLLVVSDSSGGVVGAEEIPFSDDVIDDLRAISGVAQVGGLARTIARNPDVGIEGVDPIRLRDSRFGTWPLRPGAASDALERVASGRGVLVDERFLDRRGAEMGDVATIGTPSGMLELPIVGVADIGILSPNGDVILSREVYAKWWNDNRIQRASIVLEEGHDVAEVSAEINRKLGSQRGVRTMSLGEFEEMFRESVRRAFSFLDMMVLLTLLVVFVGTADALAANVIERTREIGTLRSLGYTPMAVGGMIVTQAAAIGVSGTVLAVVLGTALSFSFVEGVLQLILGWSLEVYPQFGAALSSAALGITACLVGGVLPAWRAARLSLVRALRYE